MDPKSLSRNLYDVSPGKKGGFFRIKVGFVAFAVEATGTRVDLKKTA